jgi:hypothetical protein
MGIQGRGQFVAYHFRGTQAFFVNIVQADGAAGQFGKAENVAHKGFGKYGAAGTNEGYFWHSEIVSFFDKITGLTR